MRRLVTPTNNQRRCQPFSNVCPHRFLSVRCLCFSQVSILASVPLLSVSILPSASLEAKCICIFLRELNLFFFFFFSFCSLSLCSLPSTIISPRLGVEEGLLLSGCSSEYEAYRMILFVFLFFWRTEGGQSSAGLCSRFFVFASSSADFLSAVF